MFVSTKGASTAKRNGWYGYTGKSLLPQNILISNERHAEAIFDELLGFETLKRLIEFFDAPPEQIFAYEKDAVTKNLSSHFGFCQEILEWAMVYEISELASVRRETLSFEMAH